MPGLLYGIEAFVIQDKELQQLETIQHSVLCEAVGLPKTTPYAVMLMELGMWKMENRIVYKKLMLYHNLINSGNERMANKIIMYQNEEGREGTWMSQVNQLSEILDVKTNACDVLKSA